MRKVKLIFRFAFHFSAFFRDFREAFASFAFKNSELKPQEEQEISIVEAHSGGKVA
jgi:hypothetical protein